MRTHGEESLQKFGKHLKLFHPNLRFTSKISVRKVNFLGVIVKLQENKFLRELYCNKTDCYLYLHYDSFHPEHIKKSRLYS